MHIKKFCLLVVITVCCIMVQGRPFFQSYDKSVFYSVMKTGGVDDINTQIAKLDNAPIPNKLGYQGALLMKKAGLVNLPKDKLNFFKQGRIKLETAILSDSTNTEYHFLRLTIQEHAPKIVKYKGQLLEDSQFVRSHFKSLSAEVQQAVLDYAKTSQVLHPEDF